MNVLINDKKYGQISKMNGNALKEYLMNDFSFSGVNEYVLSSGLKTLEFACNLLSDSNNVNYSADDILKVLSDKNYCFDLISRCSNTDAVKSYFSNYFEDIVFDSPGMDQFSIPSYPFQNTEALRNYLKDFVLRVEA